MEASSINSAAAMMRDVASVRLAHAAHQLAKTEISTDPHTALITVSNESGIAAVLTETASDLHQYSLNILA